jgi:16S rRNA (guanine527-N7)-methyltransferase
LSKIEFDSIGLTLLLGEGVEALSLSLSDAQVGKLIAYLAMLVKWNAVYNLTAVRDPEQMVTQHLLDSLAVIPYFTNAENILDVGAGGGLPGVVLAIWAAESCPSMRVSMIDTVHKKTAFLTQVKGELGLSNVTVFNGRVETLQVEKKFEVITSRAFAELQELVRWANHLLAQRGRFIAMKGQVPNNEISLLPSGWTTEVRPLTVPGLEAERHLIIIERTDAKPG